MQKPASFDDGKMKDETLYSTVKYQSIICEYEQKFVYYFISRHLQSSPALSTSLIVEKTL